MCDSSKESNGFTDHKSEEKILIFDWFVSKKTVFIFSSDLWLLSQRGSFELSHIGFQWFSFFDFTRRKKKKKI